MTTSKYLIFLLVFAHLAHGAVKPPVSVFTEKIAPKEIFNVLTFPARIESKVNAVIRCEADGAVTKILKPLGSHVRRGETIAVIRHTDPVYEYAPLAVVASVTGVVSEVQITQGSLVNKGDPIVTITDPTRLRVMIEVASFDLNSIHAGLKGELSIAGINKPFAAEVKGVSPAIDPMLGTATCELSVAMNDKKQIMSGLVGRVQFKVNQHQGIMLPEYAIVYHGEDTFVRVVNAGKASRIPVKLGDRRQGQVEILGGLKAGDEVIDRANRFVSDGEAIKVESARE